MYDGLAGRKDVVQAKALLKQECDGGFKAACKLLGPLKP